MVVDDEPIVVESIKHIINKHFSYIEVYTAHSGYEAIHIAQETRINMIFMDISMPDISGIEALKEIHTLYKNILCVIITAHEKFEYAKQAIQLQVYDYLLKPISKEKIITLTNQLIVTLDKVNRQQKENRVLRESHSKLQPLIENELINYLIFDKKECLHGVVFEELNKVQQYGGSIFIIKLRNNHPIIRNQKGYIQKRIREVLKLAFECYISDMNVDQVIVFLPIQNEPETSMNSRLQIIKQQLVKELQLEIALGIGKYYTHTKDMKSSYNDAQQALNKVLHLGRSDKLKEIEEIETRLIEEMKYNTVSENLYVLDRMLACYLEAFEFDKVKFKLGEMIIILNRKVGYQVQIGLFNVIEEMQLIQDEDELVKWARNRVYHIIQQVQEDKMQGESELIIKTKTFIREHYPENLTLEKLAKQIPINPNYLSHIFKVETGTNLMDYLVTVRIEKAKHLIESTQLSTKQIGIEVGYTDSNYFSRIFKKKTGVTPTDFRLGKR